MSEKKFTWIKKSKGYNLYGVGSDRISSNKLMCCIGRVSYDEIDNEYVFNQKLFVRNLCEETIKEVSNKLTQLNSCKAKYWLD